MGATPSESAVYGLGGTLLALAVIFTGCGCAGSWAGAWLSEGLFKSIRVGFIVWSITQMWERVEMASDPDLNFCDDPGRNLVHLSLSGVLPIAAGMSTLVQTAGLMLEIFGDYFHDPERDGRDPEGDWQSPAAVAGIVAGTIMPIWANGFSFALTGLDYPEGDGDYCLGTKVWFTSQSVDAAIDYVSASEHCFLFLLIMGPFYACLGCSYTPWCPDCKSSDEDSGGTVGVKNFAVGVGLSLWLMVGYPIVLGLATMVCNPFPKDSNDHWASQTVVMLLAGWVDKAMLFALKNFSEDWDGGSSFV